MRSSKHLLETTTGKREMMRRMIRRSPHPRTGAATQRACSHQRHDELTFCQQRLSMVPPFCTCSNGWYKLFEIQPVVGCHREWLDDPEVRVGVSMANDPWRCTTGRRKRTPVGRRGSLTGHRLIGNSILNNGPPVAGSSQRYLLWTSQVLVVTCLR